MNVLPFYVCLLIEVFIFSPGQCSTFLFRWPKKKIKRKIKKKLWRTVSITKPKLQQVWQWWLPLVDAYIRNSWLLQASVTQHTLTAAIRMKTPRFGYAETVDLRGHCISCGAVWRFRLKDILGQDAWLTTAEWDRVYDNTAKVKE